MTDIERIIGYMQKRLDCLSDPEEWRRITRYMEGGELREFRQLCRDDEIIIAALRAQAEAEVAKNAPLTLEELREMDGEPVWLHTFSAVQKKTNIAQWAILESVGNANAVFLRAGCNARLTKWFANYGMTWLAYRRKPEEGTPLPESPEGDKKAPD